MKIEHLIISKLLYNEEYTREISPFLKSEYFQEKTDKIVFGLALSFFQTYNKLATKTALFVNLQKLTDLNEKEFESCYELIENIEQDESDLPWVIQVTEDFCKDQSLHNALKKSIKIAVDSGDKKSGLSKGAIPQLLSEALSVSFDTHIGHDYIRDAEKRYDVLHSVEQKIPLPLEILNIITKGGFSPKTLNMFLMGTYVGKSALMCACAAHQLLLGYNVLYITLEMSEEQISNRIDSNILDIPIEEMENTSKKEFLGRIDKLSNKTNGIIKVKEYPNGTVTAQNFKHLLYELKQKENFVPHIIYIDYLNLCKSATVMLGGSINTYTYYKIISEELRALAITEQLPIVTATQLNRGGSKTSEPGMADMAESFGVNFGLDFLLAGYTSDELKQLKQIGCVQLKNRYRNAQKNEYFTIGFDYEFMRYFDVDQNPDTPVMDNTKIGESIKHEKKKSKFEFEEIK